MNDADSEPRRDVILTVNGGSSSIKFAVFPAVESGAAGERLLSGQVERIGTAGAGLSFRKGKEPEQKRGAEVGTFAAGVDQIIGLLREQMGEARVIAVGHRIVHGGEKLLEHRVIDAGILAELRRVEPLDLAHLPREIALIEGFTQAFAGVEQVACFDTAFHRDMPRVAQLLAIPRRYLDGGLRRFGFHGLSYTFLMDELRRIAGEVAMGRVVLAHLGSGASMAAVHGGKPIETTMGFTPTSGLVMATRPGDMDAGLCVYLMHQEKLGVEAMDRFISKECGLLGVSGGVSDMRDLVEKKQRDAGCADAFDLFCYQAKKQLAGLAATMGGIDTLVFSGGIGEHSPEARSAICAGLEFLGIRLDEEKNRVGATEISREVERVNVRVIATDEEAVIARITRGMVVGRKEQRTTTNEERAPSDAR
jgi:acetate kinase